jgi:hypothetical protein
MILIQNSATNTISKIVTEMVCPRKIRKLSMIAVGELLIAHQMFVVTANGLSMTQDRYILEDVIVMISTKTKTIRDTTLTVIEMGLPIQIKVFKVVARQALPRVRVQLAIGKASSREPSLVTVTTPTLMLTPIRVLGGVTVEVSKPPKAQRPPQVASGIMIVTERSNHLAPGLGKDARKSTGFVWGRGKIISQHVVLRLPLLPANAKNISARPVSVAISAPGVAAQEKSKSLRGANSGSFPRLPEK